MHDSLRKCPAKGQLCNFCRRVGHFEKMCFKKNRRPTANTLPSKISEAEAQSGAVVSQVESRTETVQIRVAIDNDCSGILPFIINTGSDWFDQNENKFLVIVDWYSEYFDVKGPFINLVQLR